MGSEWGDRARASRSMRATSDPQAPLVNYANAAAITEWTGCTYRQLDYWCRDGLLGDGLRNIGSGRRRVYTPVVFEMVDALTSLAAVGVVHDERAVAAAAVAARPVSPDGEVLVLYLDGRVHRFDKHACLEPGTDPCWVVSLRPAPHTDAALAADTARAG